MADPAPSAIDHRALSSEVTLSPRELRGLRIIERFPWLAPVAVAVGWILFLGSKWYQLGVILEHGAAYGLSTPSDVWRLVNSWSEAKRLLHPYEVFVIGKVDSTISQGTLLILLTMFVVSISMQNRLILKLWHVVRARRSTSGCS
jgi:hypothetical protein